MAVTYTKIDKGVTEDGRRSVEADVTFDSSYPTGGEAVVLASLGLKEVRAMEIVFTRPPSGRGGSSSYTSTGYQVVPVLTNPLAPLYKVFYNGAELADTTNIATVVVRVRHIGY